MAFFLYYSSVAAFFGSFGLAGGGALPPFESIYCNCFAYYYAFFLSYYSILFIAYFYAAYLFLVIS